MVSTILDSEPVRTLVQLALNEDTFEDDRTSELCVDAGLKARGRLLAKQDLVVCGAALLPVIARLSGMSAEVLIKSPDGSWLKSGQIVGEIYGSARTLLALERTMLNFLQRLCGIATFTRRVTQVSPGMLLYDTRKTTPGWRALEKYAVTVGGGTNHRMSLSDMILIKNNHIDLNRGDLRGVLTRVMQGKSPELAVELEVRDMNELRVALDTKLLLAGRDRIMFDNMSDEDIERGLKYAQEYGPGIQIEISGGVTDSRLARLRSLGVQCVSMGALTQSSGVVDISLRIERA